MISGSEGLSLPRFRDLIVRNTVLCWAWMLMHTHEKERMTSRRKRAHTLSPSSDREATGSLRGRSPAIDTDSLSSLLTIYRVQCTDRTGGHWPEQSESFESTGWIARGQSARVTGFHLAAAELIPTDVYSQPQHPTNVHSKPQTNNKQTKAINKQTRRRTKEQTNRQRNKIKHTSK